VVLRLIGEEPEECEAHGASYVRKGVQDVVFCYLRFPSGIVAHLHLSWLDPHKERRLTVVGARRMATFDDMLIEGKLTIYRQGLLTRTRAPGASTSPARETCSPRACPTQSRCGSSASISWSASAPEPRPRSDGHSGLRVVRVLEQLQRSLEG